MVHLLSALSHTHRAVLAQQRAPDKTNEIPGFTELLSCLDPALLQGAVITADAMHSQREAAKFLHALPVLRRRKPTRPVRGHRRPGLGTHPLAHTTHDRRRGRREKRTIQVLPAPQDLRFPHAAQVFLIERYTYGTQGNMVRACAALGVISMSSDIADGQRFLAYNRGQWSIENPFH